MDVCRILKTKIAFKTTYNPQTNDQFEGFNRTILASLLSFIEDHLRAFDLYTTELTYA